MGDTVTDLYPYIRHPGSEAPSVAILLILLPAAVGALGVLRVAERLGVIGKPGRDWTPGRGRYR